MNKAQIDGFIPKAYILLEKVGVAENKKIKKTFRGYISSFGAAVCMGSLRSAVAFYSRKNDAGEDRHKLMQIIYYLLKNEMPAEDADFSGTTQTFDLFEFIENQEDEAAVKESVYNAAIAVKLAMNMYTLV